jgi:hypothetical protein
MLKSYMKLEVKSKLLVLLKMKVMKLKILLKISNNLYIINNKC